jgi:hypothetical protein
MSAPEAKAIMVMTAIVIGYAPDADGIEDWLEKNP